MADIDLVQVGLADGAKDGAALVPQSDQGGPEGQAGHEGAGSVHRVQHPDELGVWAVFAVFLADEAVVGKACGNETADLGFGALVGGGDGIQGPAGVLVLQTMIAAEQGQDHLAGSAVQLEDEGVEVGEAVGGEHGPAIDDLGAG